MLGCFGRRKKKNKDAAKPGGKSGKSNAPEPKASSKTGENDRTPAPAASKTVDNKQVRVTPQITIESPSQPDADKTATEVPSEVTETITVTRSQSMHQAPPKPGNIKKAATMSRYDFLRKQDNINYADRWASLKKRYLAAKPENGGVVGKDGGDEAETQPASRAAPKSPHRATVQSLPRQFSPPSNGPPSPVKFSDWFYDRQTREAEARQEFHDREERMRKIIEGPSKDELEEAAVKIQAGYKGYRTRKDMKAKREEAAPDAGEEAEAEKPQQQDEAQEQAAKEPQQENPEEEIDLNDPELAQAAIKIQAGFKGYQTRKKLKDETGQEQQDEAAEQKEAEEEQKPAAAEEEEQTDEAKGEADSDAANAVDPNDPAQNQAASKIQAGFRGMQARKEVAEMRKSGQEQGEAKSAEGESEEPAEGESEEPAEPAAVEDEAEPEAKAEPEPEAEADEAKPETEADEHQPEAEPEADSKPEAEPEAEPESEDKPEAEAEAEPEAPEATESAAAAAAPGEEENEAAAPAAADDAAGAEGDEPRDE